MAYKYNNQNNLFKHGLNGPAFVEFFRFLADLCKFSFSILRHDDGVWQRRRRWRRADNLSDHRRGRIHVWRAWRLRRDRFEILIKIIGFKYLTTTTTNKSEKFTLTKKLFYFKLQLTFYFLVCRRKTFRVFSLRSIFFYIHMIGFIICPRRAAQILHDHTRNHIFFIVLNKIQFTICSAYEVVSSLVYTNRCLC